MIPWPSLAPRRRSGRSSCREKEQHGKISRFSKRHEGCGIVDDSSLSPSAGVFLTAPCGERRAPRAALTILNSTMWRHALHPMVSAQTLRLPPRLHRGGTMPRTAPARDLASGLTVDPRDFSPEEENQLEQFSSPPATLAPASRSAQSVARSRLTSDSGLASPRRPRNVIGLGGAVRACRRPA